MGLTINPGLLFQAAPIYGLGPERKGPLPNTTYLVLGDGSIQDYHHPERAVDWEITEDENGWYADGAPLAVYFRGRVKETPQNAEIIEQKDVGDEITSIAKIDPLLAQCALIVNDPVQTTAMAKFAEGKMSYAEMRGLCG
jgi:hypothetical protein